MLCIPDRRSPSTGNLGHFGLKQKEKELFSTLPVPPGCLRMRYLSKNRDQSDVGLRADQIAIVFSLLKTELVVLEKRACVVTTRSREKVRGKTTNLKIQSPHCTSLLEFKVTL